MEAKDGYVSQGEKEFELQFPKQPLFVIFFVISFVSSFSNFSFLVQFICILFPSLSLFCMLIIAMPSLSLLISFNFSLLSTLETRLPKNEVTIETDEVDMYSRQTRVLSQIAVSSSISSLFLSIRVWTTPSIPCIPCISLFNSLPFFLTRKRTSLETHPSRYN